MAIKKGEILIHAIMQLQPDEAEKALGFAKVLCNLSDVNEPQLLEKLTKLENNCYKGLDISECAEILNLYYGQNLNQRINHDKTNQTFEILDLKTAMKKLYYKIIDGIMNINYDMNFHIGNSLDENYKKYDEGN